MPRLLWTLRTWEFDFPSDLFPAIVERLRGAPARVEEAVRELDAALLRQKNADAWSIQEHVGHLFDLEALPRARLADFLAGAEILTAADMTNRVTHEAGHNERTIESITAAFRRARGQLVSRLDALDPEDFERVALHPRLETPMRMVDMCLFQADHDDHHLAEISALRRSSERSD